MKEKSVFYDPTRDNGEEYPRVGIKNYENLYGISLTETFHSSKLVVVMQKSEIEKSKLIFNFLKEICSKLLKEGNSSGILYQGILKRVILSKDIGLIVGLNDGEVKDLRLCFGKTAKNLLEDREIVNLIQSLINVLDSAMKGVSRLYIELGFLYVSCADMRNGFPFVVSVVNHEGNSIARLAYLNTEQGLYDVDTKYKSILNSNQQDKVRYTGSWKPFGFEYSNVVKKVGMCIEDWFSSMRGQIQGDTFLLRTRSGSIEEIVNSVPSMMRISSTDNSNSDWSYYLWRRGKDICSEKLLDGIYSIDFPLSFPNVHNIRWDTSLYTEGVVKGYWSKSLEPSAVDVWITSKDILTQ